ncbi:MAG: DUF2332 domain-containing protein [Paucibacter sp.]|nr:DUF2332 domain-containing protein [Roseateles sp.]
MNDLAEQFRRFADQECTEDPLYVALCHAIAEAPALLGLMRHTPTTQARPNLLLAALHERVLTGSGQGLRDYYPSVGGTRRPDASLAPLLSGFVQAHQSRIADILARRSTQTNEIGRCAVLWPALTEVARLSGKTELALFDFGSSAGLNLGVDRYCFDYGSLQLGAAQGPVVHSRWHGAAPPPATPWRIVQRLGVDPKPVDVDDEEAVNWLRACLWPHDLERAARLQAAVALARASGDRVRQAQDGLSVLAAWLDALPGGAQPVLFNSWVLAYLCAADFRRHRERVAAMVHERGLIEISAEVIELAPAGLAPPPACTVPDPQTPTLWTLQSREGVHALAWSHGHGRWLEWLK